MIPSQISLCFHWVGCMKMGPHAVISISWYTGNMVVPMEQWAGQPFQDNNADLWVVMPSDHNKKYSDMMERSYKAFAVTFELKFPFPLIP